MKKFFPFLITAIASIAISLIIFKLLFRDPTQGQIYIVSSTIGNAQKEIASLKLQVETLKEFQSSILDAVYWSLSAVLGMFSILMGINWFSNAKQQEDERRSHEEKLDKKIEALIVEINSKILAYDSSIVEKMDARLVLFKNQHDRELDNFRNEFIRMIRSLRKDLAKLGVDVSSLEGKSSDLDKRIHLQLAELRDVEEKIWELDDNPSNIVLTQVQKLISYFEASDKIYIDKTLKSIKSTIESRFIRDNRRFSHAVGSALVEGISHLAPSHPAIVGEICDMINQNTDPKDF